MKNCNTYGRPPYTVAVIHGGPGAAGEMAPVAVKLASSLGVIEPLQTAMTVEGQVEELARTLRGAAPSKKNIQPLALTGFSWGAWLSCLCAAKYPDLVRKLVLISSGPFEEKYTAAINQTRMERLDDDERTEVLSHINMLEGAGPGKGSPCHDDYYGAVFERLGSLLAKADTYSPDDQVAEKSSTIDCSYQIYRRVWKEAAVLRKSGQLLKKAGMITCPVIAIHGEYDSHPAKGVYAPLTEAVSDFTFILLEKCGHKPWIEKEAKDKFFKILKELL